MIWLWHLIAMIYFTSNHVLTFKSTCKKEGHVSHWDSNPVHLTSCDMVGWEYTSWLELFKRIIVSLYFHRLLICKFQWRSIRLTNPWVVEYSLTTRHSSTLPSWLSLADLENFHKNHIGLGTLCGNERSLLCSHLFPTTGEHFSFYNF